MELMQGLCDSKGGYFYEDKKSKSIFKFDQGGESADKLWEAEVTGGLRTTSSYTHSLKSVIDIITIKEDVMPVGSFKYNVHKYPGDIDIFEHLNVCCCVDDAKNVATKRIQGIIQKLRSATDVYFGDFKTGEDRRFDINVGHWDGEDLVDYDSSRIRSDVNSLYQQGLISKDEFDEFLEILKDNPNEEEWKSTQEFLKEFKTLRWTAEELSQGYKILPGNLRITLGDALNHQTLVKIDLWARINDKYTEVTNFFLIAAVNSNGKRVALLTQELPDYVLSISRDVVFYSEPEHRKTLKALKRLWSLSLFKGDLKLAERISPLFSTNGAALNQLTGEAEVLSLMLKKLDNPPLNNIIIQLDAFKPRIDQLSTLPNENQKIYEAVDSVVNVYYDHPNSFDRFQASETIANIQKMIANLVENMISIDARKAGFENPGDYV
jgi:hypothetical protein